jgi:hypothetical protein
MKIFDQLAATRDEEGYMIDATIIKAHQDSAGAQKKMVRKALALPEAVIRRKSTPSLMRSAIRIASRSPQGRRTT